MIRQACMSIAVALCVGLTHAVAAQDLSNLDYRFSLNAIAVDYKAAAAACSAESGNAKDICTAKANGRRDISRAELDERRQPGARAAYDVAVAKAKAAYAIARERCDDLSYDESKPCVAEIRATEASALSEARAALARQSGAGPGFTLPAR